MLTVPTKNSVRAESIAKELIDVSGQKNDQEVARLAKSLHDDLKVERVAPGHCTGENEFAALKKTYGDHYLYAGLGTVRSCREGVKCDGGRAGFLRRIGLQMKFLYPWRGPNHHRISAFRAKRARAEWLSFY